ncbi:DUF1735 domain-containing protein [Sphingobacterium siyangense]|uniref:DUF1735 domain-containing protein n=1 Tax=Sphingobacterium siyangense TaxID=459529 RepID=UPI003DA459B0
MKKILKYISLAIAIPVLATSCLKDDAIIGPDAPGAINNVIEWKNISTITSSTTSPYAVFVPATLDPEKPEITINAYVRYAGVEAAPSDIEVKLSIDPTIVATYNKSQSGTLNALSANAFEIPTSVVIKGGEREALVPIKLHVDKFDQSKENVLPLVISSTSSNTPVSGNFGAVIYSFPVKSIWEGTYTYTIHNDYGSIDGSIGGTFTEEDVKLTTVGPNKLNVQYLWRTYSGYTQYQFNGDNTSITSITAFSGSARPTVIDKVVVVDEEKRIFEVNWTCLGRGVRERFVRTGD